MFIKSDDIFTKSEDISGGCRNIHKNVDIATKSEDKATKLVDISPAYGKLSMILYSTQSIMKVIEITRVEGGYFEYCPFNNRWDLYFIWNYFVRPCPFGNRSPRVIFILLGGFYKNHAEEE